MDYFDLAERFEYFDTVLTQVIQDYSSTGKFFLKKVAFFFLGE